MPAAPHAVMIAPGTCRSYTCVQVFGGLGNQMFQYAAGYAQSHRLGTQLLVDPVESERLAHASYGLGAFDLDVGLWSPDPTAGGGWQRLFRRPKAKHRFESWPGAVYRHAGQAYDPAIAAVGPGTYLAGYFQSERFFTDVANDIRSSMQKHAGVFRTQALMDEGVQQIAAIRERVDHIHLQDKSKVFNTALVESLEVANLIEVAQATIVSAAARHECRGAHTVYDYEHPADDPNAPLGRDDKNWLKHTLWDSKSNSLSYKPVNLKPLTVDTVPPKVRTF